MKQNDNKWNGIKDYRENINVRKQKDNKWNGINDTKVMYNANNVN